MSLSRIFVQSYTSIMKENIIVVIVHKLLAQKKYQNVTIMITLKVLLIKLLKC